MNIKRTSFNPRLKKIIKEGFNEHTLSKQGIINASEYEAISLYDKKLIGSIVFRSFWGSIEVKYLYIDKTFRGKGYGSILLNEVTNIAKNEYKCKTMYLDTLSFQALDFYIKLGFKLEFTRDGFEKNIKRHYLSRDIT